MKGVPFWDLVNIKSQDECWPWTRRVDKDRYGTLNRVVNGVRYQRAHRLAYRLHHEVDPADLLVIHSCDNPPCCNPAHLQLGSVRDNNADMIAKHRERYPVGDEHWSRRRPERVKRGVEHYAYGRPGRHGEAHPSARLTDQQVQQIRDRYAAGGVYQRELAAEYGVSKGHINALILRRFRRE